MGGIEPTLGVLANSFQSSSCDDGVNGLLAYLLFVMSGTTFTWLDVRKGTRGKPFPIQRYQLKSCLRSNGSGRPIGYNTVWGAICECV